MTAATLTRPQAARRTPAGSAGFVSFGEPVRLSRPVGAPAAVSAAVPSALPAAVPAPVPARRVRLTRRGRAVLLLVAAGLLLVAISVGRTGSQAATFTETGPALQQTTVQQGETLWSVARRIAPDNDPREVIVQLRRINHLQGSTLRVGQQLLLPTAG
jgi:hypothetical protein